MQVADRAVCLEAAADDSMLAAATLLLAARQGGHAAPYNISRPLHVHVH